VAAGGACGAAQATNSHAAATALHIDKGKDFTAGITKGHWPR
jgi:hypothetical protein